MRKLNIAIVLLAGVTIFSGCSKLKKMIDLAKQQDLTVTPNPLELHGNEVKFEMSAVLPQKMLATGYVYTLRTFYQYGNEKANLEDLAFKAEDFPNSSTTTSRLSKEYSFQYQDGMESGDLKIQGVASDPRSGKNLETPDQPTVAVGLIMTSRLAQNIYETAYASHGYNENEELIATKIEFYFDKGRSELKSSETRSDRGKQFTAFIAEKNVTKTVTITGTHSPEGAERINSKLSNDRAARIEAFYRTNMKKYDYKGMADGINFVLKPVVEDWGLFTAAMRDYEGVEAGAKVEIGRIINGAGTFEDKEKSLQKMSVYPKLLKDIYPGLRAAKTEILTVLEKKPNSEIAVLAKQIAGGTISADSLSEAELLFAGTLTPSLSEKEAIYKAATKKNPSYTAHNNLGAVYLEMAKAASSDGDRNNYIDQALSQLDIAANKMKGAEVLANQASAYLMQGNNDKAYATLSEAEGASPSREVTSKVKAMKGGLEILQGEYDTALATMSGANESADLLFNRGLAMVLKKEYDNAKSAFNDALVKDSSYALAHYGNAIANARQRNQDQMISNLKNAVNADPSLKEKAIVDLEFNNFANAVKAAL
ncbi:MAG: hypothetical protein O2951_13595 [Bacteroidetes bacterium]|nr:hypothetical protein [Bacteroidota bacterium]